MPPKRKRSARMAEKKKAKVGSSDPGLTPKETREKSRDMELKALQDTVATLVGEIRELKSQSSVPPMVHHLAGHAAPAHHQPPAQGFSLTTATGDHTGVDYPSGASQSSANTTLGALPNVTSTQQINRGKPKPSFGMSPNDVSHYDIISPSIRKDIIQGKNVNLALLLLPDNHAESLIQRSMVI